MKITQHFKNDFVGRFEDLARKLNQTAPQMVAQDSQALAEHLRVRASELFSIVKNTLFRPRMTALPPELLRRQVRKKVFEYLEEEFHYPEVIDGITDCLVQVAEEDPRTRRVLLSA